MKNKKIIIPVLAVCVVYLISVYVLADFNIVHWTQEQRFGSGIFISFALIFSVFITNAPE